MKFMRVGPVGAERPIVMDDEGAYFDLRQLTDDIDGAFLATDGVTRTREALTAGALQRTELGAERVGSPLAQPPAVICIGMNYAAHAAETGAPPPTQPIVFFKHPNTVVGPYDDLALPPNAKKVDWEVELAVVIGRQARYLRSPSDATAVIAGYACSNDVSERAYQLEHSGGQWSKGKSAETFNPLGPWLVPAADISDVQDLRVRTWVNGDARQDSTTADMIFDVPYLVWHLSRYLVLSPGDVINTGTPAGVALSGRFPYLVAGDVVEVEIAQLGRQRQSAVPVDLGYTPVP